MPDLYIITGSNGAGKSTLGAEYLPEHIKINNITFDSNYRFDLTSALFHRVNQPFLSYCR